MWRLYPRFGVSSQNEIFPHVPVPTNYRDLVSKFYESKGKERVEELTSILKKVTRLDIQLRWHQTHGLTNISTSTPSGMDLDERECEFVPHNMAGLQSLAAGAIAMEYVRQLLIKNRV